MASLPASQRTRSAEQLASSNSIIYVGQQLGRASSSLQLGFQVPLTFARTSLRHNRIGAAVDRLWHKRALGELMDDNFG